MSNLSQKPHGNSKKSLKPYERLNPNVREELLDLTKEKTPHGVARDLACNEERPSLNQISYSRNKNLKKKKMVGLEQLSFISDPIERMRKREELTILNNGEKWLRVNLDHPFRIQILFSDETASYGIRFDSSAVLIFQEPLSLDQTAKM